MKDSHSDSNEKKIIQTYGELLDLLKKNNSPVLVESGVFWFYINKQEFIEFLDDLINKDPNIKDSCYKNKIVVRDFEILIHQDPPRNIKT